MAEPEPTPRAPEPTPFAAGSEVPPTPLDVPALERTADYPLNPTVSYPDTPSARQRSTVTAPPGPPDAEPHDPPENLPDISGYRMLRVISSGGMGTVFKAVHLAMNRVVAIKLINAGWVTESDFRIRFEREVKTLASIEHPNIIPVYNAGLWQGLPFLTMKYVPGKTLYHHLERLQKDLRTACQILIQVARAVHHLHDRGIIHRDLKPLNILMAEENTPLVADFGLVRLVDDNSDLSLTLIPLGTRQYMSPEQTHGGRANYTPACDIWALGIVIYETLTGQRPFGDEDHVELFRQIRQDAPPPMPPELNVPPGLEAIARKCLEKSPADRYAAAEAVARDLERWLAGEAVLAPPAITPSAVPMAPEPIRVPAEPTRAVPRTSNRLLAVGVLAVIALIAVPAAVIPFKQPTVQRTLAERIEAGETVWLVGEKGLPKVPVLPGIPSSSLTTDQDGYCSLSGRTAQFAELIGEQLPLPIHLEAQIALRQVHPELGHGGVYIGRQVVVRPDGPAHALWKIGAIDKDNQQREGNILIATDRGYLAVTVFKQNQRNPIDLPLDTSLRVETRRTVVGNAPPPDWHPIRVTIREHSFEAQYHGQPFVSINAQQSLRRWCVANDWPPNTFPVGLGPGIGIFAENAEVSFRNVRVSPVRP